MTTDPVVSPVQGEAVESCRMVEIDGQLVRVRGAAEMDDTDRSMLAEVVRAAKAKYMAEGGAERLADSLELLRQHLCGYVGQPTCDCKYGASGRGEQTGCPELRDAIDYLRTTAAGEVERNYEPAPAVPTAREGETERFHIPQIARRTDGSWGVFCAACSAAVGDRQDARWLIAELRDARADVERQQKLVLRQTQLNTEVTLRAMEAESQRSALAASLAEVEKERDATAANALREVDKISAERDAAEAKLAAVRSLADFFQARLPDGTGNGRVYNSHRVAAMIRAALDAETVTEHE